MKINGFYRFNGVNEEDSKKGVEKIISELSPKIEDTFGSFKYELKEIKQVEEDVNYYRNDDKCYRVYFTAIFNDNDLKEKDLNSIGLYFYTDIEIEK